MMIKVNPTDSIDISFENYVKEHKKSNEIHLEGGIPDYAYAMDYSIRQKIKAMPGAFPFFKAITNQIVPLMKQEINLNALKVGPTQFSEIYAMVQDCARILGIGIPSVFIQNNLGEMNACTYATDDEAPLIVINSSLIERFNADELKAVIGHECGHIHNHHGTYEIASNAILNAAAVSIPIVRQILGLVSMPLQYMLMAWSRAAEVTADRAGLICSNNSTDIITVNAKLLYGATFNRSDISIDSIIKQYDMLRSTPVRLLELSASHPASVRRIFASKEFLDSEVLYKWRPEWKTPDLELIDKQMLDARCEKYISVFKSEKRR